MSDLSYATRFALARDFLDSRWFDEAARRCGVAPSTAAAFARALSDAAWVTHDVLVREVQFDRVRCSEVCVGDWPVKIASGGSGVLPGLADVFIWTAIEIRSNLIVAHLVGLKALPCLVEFVSDTTSRLASDARLTRNPSGLVHLERADGRLIDEEVSVDQLCGRGDEVWLSDPAALHVRDVASSLAIQVFQHNFVQTSSNVTPAMSCGLTNQVWGPIELVMLLEHGGAGASLLRALAHRASH